MISQKNLAHSLVLKVFKYFLKLDQKQHVCTASIFFPLYFYIVVYISFIFVIRLRLILQIFSIRNSFKCFFLLILLITSWSSVLS